MIGPRAHFGERRMRRSCASVHASGPAVRMIDDRAARVGWPIQRACPRRRSPCRRKAAGALRPSRGVERGIGGCLSVHERCRSREHFDCASARVARGHVVPVGFASCPHRRRSGRIAMRRKDRSRAERKVPGSAHFARHMPCKRRQRPRPMPDRALWATHSAPPRGSLYTPNASKAWRTGRSHASALAETHSQRCKGVDAAVAGMRHAKAEAMSHASAPAAWAACRSST